MFDRLFRRRSTGLDKQSAHGRINAVHADLDELIALRLQARQLSLGSRRHARHLLAGNHVSAFKGRGMDYMESRIYQAGDDIRNMDWKVTARTGVPHVKLFQEERQRPVIIMVDFSPSLFFASRGRFKSVIASQAAALLAWSAQQNGDRVGGIISGRQHREIAAGNAHQNVLRLLQGLALASSPHDNLQSEGQFNAALERLVHLNRPGSLVFVISDFYQLDAAAMKKLVKIHNHSDCMLLRVRDSLELQPPPPGYYPVTDGVRRGFLATDRPQAQQHYQQWFSQQHQQVEHFARHYRLPLVELQTHVLPVNTLRNVFSARRAGPLHAGSKHGG